MVSDMLEDEKGCWQVLDASQDDGSLEQGGCKSLYTIYRTWS